MMEQQFTFLGNVYTQFKRSELAYKGYLDNNRTFLYARILKECNEAIRNLLLQNSFLLSENLMQDALALITHYDVWIEKWNDLEAQIKPSLNDEFVFQNSITFPKTAAINIENKFLALKSEMN